MRKRAAAPLILLLAAGCGGSGGPASASASSPASAATLDARVTVLTAANFDGLVLAGSRPSMVDFYSTTCPHCQAMAPVVSRVAADFEGRALVGGVNVASEAALTQRYGVTGVPTFVFFKGGREVSRVVGETSYDDLAGRLRTLAGS